MSDSNKSHKQILKSTSIVGGSQVINIIVGVVRTKVIALLLGPSGIGIIGILQSTVDIVRQTTSFGINLSGVKDIAEAAASDDKERIFRTITILRRWALYTGLLGMFVTIVLSYPLSRFAFNTEAYTLSIAILSVTLLTTSISAGQLALLQGLRRISTMAKALVYGSILSTVTVLPLYWWFGEKGIVPGMVFSSVIVLIISWSYSRKIKVIAPNISFTQVIKEGWGMGKLGLFIVITTIAGSFATYLIRIFVGVKMDMDAVGCFQAVIMISSVYFNVILNSMLADFFPRLSAVNADNEQSNKLINEQMEMTVIIASPMIISLIACAELCIKILYSSEFLMAVDVLQWQLFGGFFSIIAWNLGVMFLAKNKGLYCLVTESIASAIFLSFVFISWDYLGFISLGIGFFVSNFFKAFINLGATKHLGGFKLSPQSLRYIIIFGILSTLILLNVLLIEGTIQYVISAILIILSLYVSYAKLSQIINIKVFIKGRLLKH